jgi:hypothetical protein
MNIDVWTSQEEKVEVMRVKKTYESPELVVRGTIEEITQGSGWGLKDVFVFGINDVIGNCGNGSCDPQTGS